MLRWYDTFIWSKTIQFLEQNSKINSWESIPEKNQTIIWTNHAKLTCPDFMFGAPVLVVAENGKNYRDNGCMVVKQTFLPKYLSKFRVLCSEIYLLILCQFQRNLMRLRLSVPPQEFRTKSQTSTGSSANQPDKSLVSQV